MSCAWHNNYIAGELIGGSQREERLEQLEAKMVEFNLSPEDYWWYNDLRRYILVAAFRASLYWALWCRSTVTFRHAADVEPAPPPPPLLLALVF